MSALVINPRPVFLVVGLLLMILSGGMVIPAFADLIVGNPDWRVFAASAGFTLFIGAAMFMTVRTRSVDLDLRQAFLMTVLAWTILPAFAALPFVLSDQSLSFTDAFFEAMSGITTTGATVLTGLDDMPPGLLLWRAILQWLGGLGIIIMALTILPMLRVGGMQMFKVEAFEAQEKVLPRATQMATVLVSLYVALTGAWAVMLWMAGMNHLDAICHAMTTIATGGFSTHDASIGFYDSVTIDVIVTAGMIVGGIPFLLIVQALRGRPMFLFTDSQVCWYLSILAVCIATMTLWLFNQKDLSVFESLRYASFNVVSVMTGTGYATTDFGLWGGFAIVVLFALMFVGGCAGSTSCGIKVFRFQILYETARVQIKRLLEPHGVFIPYFNRRPLDDGIAEAVMGFFFLYAVSVGVLAAMLSWLGLDFITALSGATSAISNVGPGLGEVIGPSSTYQSLPDAAKWLLSAGMLLGRLELFTVFVLLMPRFWRG